jgi:hypothetical protein
MSVTVQDIDSLTSIHLKIKGPVYPQCREMNLPRMFFAGLWVGGRESGKTHSVTELLKMYEMFGIYAPDGKKVEQRIIMFSPTYHGNVHFWNNLKHLDEGDVHTRYSDAELTSVVDDVKQQQDETDEYKRLLKVYDRCVHSKDGSDISTRDFKDLQAMDFKPPPAPRYPNGCVVFLVMDDLIGSRAYKSTGESYFTQLVLRNRHTKMCVLMLAQSLKNIPKSLRINVNVFVLFSFANSRIVTEDLYDELSNKMSLNEFEALYTFATSATHGSLVIDFSQPKGRQFKLGWSKLCFLSCM